MSNGWIGVDLDGTLAHYESGDFEKHGGQHIGQPVPAMLRRVQKWLREGVDVRIVTARVSGVDWLEQRTLIQEWCKKHLGRKLIVTNRKDYDMLELWDDRARQVERNTGVAYVLPR